MTMQNLEQIKEAAAARGFPVINGKQCIGLVEIVKPDGKTNRTYRLEDGSEHETQEE